MIEYVFLNDSYVHPPVTSTHSKYTYIGVVCSYLVLSGKVTINNVMKAVPFCVRVCDNVCIIPCSSRQHRAGPWLCIQNGKDFNPSFKEEKVSEINIRPKVFKCAYIETLAAKGKKSSHRKTFLLISMS